MKKVCALILFLLFISIATTGAQSLEGIDKDLQEKREQAEDLKDILEDDDSRSAYLKEEWEKALEKTSLGRGLLQIGNTLTALDPLWKIVLGITFSFSLLFFLTIILWLFFAINISRLLFAFPPIVAKFSQLISIAITILISFLGITKTIASLVITATSILPWFIQIAIIIIIIFLLIFISKYASQFKKQIKSKRVVEKVKKAGKEAKEAKATTKETKSESEEFFREIVEAATEG